MSFSFNWPEAGFPAAFYEHTKRVLEKALNTGKALPLIEDNRIVVKGLSFGSVPPELDLLTIDEANIGDGCFAARFMLSYNGDASLSLATNVQVNPLTHYKHTLEIIATPSALLERAQLPVHLTFSHLKLRAIIVLAFSKHSGLSLAFKEDPLESLKISSSFDSFTVLNQFLQTEIEHQLRERFRRDLPTMIHRLSQKWLADIRGSSTSTPTNEIVVKREADSDLEDSRAGAVAATINPESREPDDSFHDYLGGGPGAEGEAGNSTNNPSPRRVAGDSRAQSEPPAPSNNLPGARKARTRGYSVTVSSSNVTDTSAPQNTSPTPYRAHHEQRNVPLATSPVHPRNSSSLHSEHSYLSSSPSESATTSGSEAEEDEDPVDPDSRSLASASETEDGTASEIDASYNYEYSRSADSNASSFYLYGHSPTDSEGFSLGSYDDLPETPPRHPSSSEHRMRRDPSGRSPLHADTETTVSRQRRRGSGGFADSDGPRDEQSGQQGGQGTRGRYKSPILQSLQRSGSTFATTFSKTLPASIVSSSDLQDENTSSRVINGGRDGALSSSSSAAHALPGEAYNALLADGRESTAKSNLQDTNAAVDATTATTKVRRRRLHRLDGSSVSPSVSPVKPRSSSRHHQREKEKMRIKKRELDEYFPMISGDGDDDTGTISTARDGSPSRTHKTSGRKGAPTRSMDTLLLPTNPPQTQHLTLPLSSTGHTGTLNTFDPRRGTSRPALVDRQLNSVPSLRRSMMNTRLRDSDYFTPSYPE